ncbi:Protein of unknown function [Granulicatella balaenopterae]|uniref:DUF3800 domain-containing protein n=1 Tax=Granulicatella balaenopterae TaxID=137733 RepID=A0A1H9M937_9LACT|nr:DUF3800 domain-containing protein [Granulicatella balaenopterae]SER20236.1 Protein of unknown function [Granulicatella balaenopterae]
MTNIYIYIDDSGVLTNNEEYFIYAGYCFIGDNEKNRANNHYKKIVKRIRRKHDYKGELKAARLSKKHKNSLFKVMQNFYSCSVVIKIDQMNQFVMQDKKAIQRYKDYALKKLVRKMIKNLLKNGIIYPEEQLNLMINIDQQTSAPKGLYNLSEGIKEELSYGIYNFNYDLVLPPLMNRKVTINTIYCISEKNYLIQAADILANRIRSSYVVKSPELLPKRKHIFVNLP